MKNSDEAPILRSDGGRMLVRAVRAVRARGDRRRTALEAACVLVSAHKTSVKLAPHFSKNEILVIIPNASRKVLEKFQN